MFWLRNEKINFQLRIHIWRLVYIVMYSNALHLICKENEIMFASFGNLCFNPEYKILMDFPLTYLYNKYGTVHCVL